MSAMQRRFRAVVPRAAGIALVLTLTAGAGTALAFSAHGSAEQVYATGLTGGQSMDLVNNSGAVVQTKAADAQGGVLYRNVAPGSGYTVRPTAGGTASDPVTVMTNDSAPPSTDFFSQPVPSGGYGYMTMRDGIQLAYTVHPPTDVKNTSPNPPAGPSPAGTKVPNAGPWPTLIEYAGYGYADPNGPQNGISVLANLMGFAVVDVNMRGTGCSGGAFDFFEQLQNLDGYDVIETVSQQPWVLHHHVGMMGISYGGISQLFTAQTQPPHLAAISPLSVIDQSATTLLPGGILNSGFAYLWSLERVHDALPTAPKGTPQDAPGYGGQDYAKRLVDGGDTICAANQALHGEAADLVGKIAANTHYNPDVADPASPLAFVNKINVPVYMACQFTDEQTGGHCPTLAEHMTGVPSAPGLVNPGRQLKWFTFTNGTHVDSLDPNTMNRWCDFLQIYVAELPPAAGCQALHATAPLIYQAVAGIDPTTAPPGELLPPDPIQAIPALPAAQIAFEQLPAIRVMFDNGAGSKPGYPDPGFEQSWPSFPIPGTTAQRWYMGANGTLNDARPTDSGADRFTWNAAARPLNDFTGDTASGPHGLWTPTPPYQWLSPPAGSAASYETAPLAANTTVVGAGQVRAWVKSSVPSADLQVTISEVRPDGKETFVQGGWLRGNESKLNDPAGPGLEPVSTELEPVLSLRAADVTPLSSTSYTPLTIPLYYEGHAYRAGSRVRVTITAPNGDQPIWSFSRTNISDTNPGYGTTANITIAHTPSMPSGLILPVVPGLSVPTSLPPCPSLRGEPCRAHDAYTNGATTP